MNTVKSFTVYKIIECLQTLMMFKKNNITMFLLNLKLKKLINI